MHIEECSTIHAQRESSIFQNDTEKGLLSVYLRVYKLFLLIIDSLVKKLWDCLGLFPCICHLFPVVRLN